MSFCSVKCPICGNWMSRSTTKRGKPYLYCGRCAGGFMVLKEATAKKLDTVCQQISESDLIPETLKKHREKT